jgi:hypothetical protein
MADNIPCRGPPLFLFTLAVPAIAVHESLESTKVGSDFLDTLLSGVDPSNHPVKLVGVFEFQVRMYRASNPKS